MQEGSFYIRFMVDIIDSGLWAELSHGAKSLYLVLLKFSDSKFKPVFPATPILMKLTGFKTKKSIIEAKKELSEKGLIKFFEGTGHTSTVYHFLFAYKKSKIPPQGSISGYPWGGEDSHLGVPNEHIQESLGGNPNQIHITINNSNQSMEPIQESTQKKSISWEGFLGWAESSLSKPTIQELKKAQTAWDGKVLLVEGKIGIMERKIITKYFTDKLPSDYLIVFTEDEEKSRLEA